MFLRRLIQEYYPTSETNEDHYHNLKANEVKSYNEIEYTIAFLDGQKKVLSNCKDVTAEYSSLQDNLYYKHAEWKFAFVYMLAYHMAPEIHASGYKSHMRDLLELSVEFQKKCKEKELNEQNSLGVEKDPTTLTRAYE